MDVVIAMSRTEEWVFGDVQDPVPRPVPGRRAAHSDRPPPVRRRAFARFVLFAVWLLCFVVGVLGVALLAAGYLRDGSFADTQMPIELSRSGDWRRTQFHPWVPGRYDVYLTTEDHEERTSEEGFQGRLYMRVETPDGRALVDERYEPPGLDHRLRGGVEWTRLTRFTVSMPSFDPWTLAVRVAHEDPVFAPVQSNVALLREKPVEGLDGLLNYAAAIPALLLLVLSVPAAIGLRRRGGTLMPALLSFVFLGALATLLYAI